MARTVTMDFHELVRIEADKESAEHLVKVLRNTTKRLLDRNEQLWRCLREMRKDRNDNLSSEFGASEETHVRSTSQYRRAERRARKSGER